jgi:hypothetical protein
VSNVLFGGAGAWSAADKLKPRLDPNQQAVAGVIRPKETCDAGENQRYTNRSNTSSVEGGIFGGPWGSPAKAACEARCPSRGGRDPNVSSVPGGILTWE